jgi:hypothetical protein
MRLLVAILRRFTLKWLMPGIVGAVFILKLNGEVKFNEISIFRKLTISYL